MNHDANSECGSIKDKELNDLQAEDEILEELEEDEEKKLSLNEELPFDKSQQDPNDVDEIMKEEKKRHEINTYFIKETKQ